MNNAHVEREGNTLTVAFRNTPPALYLVMGAPFVAMSGLALAGILLVGLVIMVYLWRTGGVYSALRGLSAGLALGLIPIAMLGLFFGVGVYLLRHGAKPVFDEAEVWIFNRADRSFTVATRKHEQRTGRRWLETRNVYSLPPPGSASERDIPGADTFDDTAVAVWTTAGEVISDGVRLNDYKRVVAHINQFLAGH